jgi:hypothetical protein
MTIKPSATLRCLNRLRNSCISWSTCCA